MTSPDSLTTTDESGKRIRLYPAAVPKNGFWEKRRFWAQWFMLLLYVAVPWIEVNGHPLLLLDIAHRRFSIFGKLFFAHEVPSLVFVVISFLMAIALFTTLFGRVWCGWACPQTVFVERIFRKIEILIEGDHLTRKKMAQAPMSFDKAFKRSLKFVVFASISVLLGQIFLGYFVGPKEAFQYLLDSPAAHPSAFISVLLMSGVVLFDFGWFREQFCLVACPYGRFQSVMMDRGSLFLAYDEKRGDCINCNKCVAVCPTGIDVRNGLQFECIACTACADACDSVMMKIKKPLHLIGYGSLDSLLGKKPKMIRGRTVIYALLLVLSSTALFFRLTSRQVYQSEVARAVDTPYQIVKDVKGDEWVINHFKIRFHNQDWSKIDVTYGLSSESAKKQIEFIASPLDGVRFNVESGSHRETQFFVKVPRSQFVDGRASGQVEMQWGNQNKSEIKEVRLVGPE